MPYADVIPLLRLPRRFTVFDYAIPSSLQVEAGDLVRVPFHGRSALGVVARVKQATDSPRTKEIERVVTRGIMTQADVDRIIELAHDIATSYPTLLETVLAHYIPEATEAPKLINKTTGSIAINKDALDRVQDLLAQMNEHHRVAISCSRDERFLLCLALRKKTEGQMLIVAPRERDAELIGESLPLGKATVVLHGKTSSKERARIIHHWRRGNIRTLVGTRQASLIAPGDLKTVVLFESGCDDHFSDRRNPRLDDRNAALALAAQTGARLVIVDDLIRPEDLMAAGTHLVVQSPRPQVIDLAHRAERGGIPLVSATMLEAIKNALQSQKSVLLFFNRKGVAKRLQCGACGHIPLCGTCGNLPTVRVDDLVCTCGVEMWLPKQCPSCGSPKIGMRGIGGAKLEAELKELFPTARIARVEKGSSASADADIVLATEFFFSSVVRPFTKRYVLVADLMSDIGFISGDFRSVERVARKTHRLIGFARDQGAECILQTFAADAVRDTLNAQIVIQKELDARIAYRLPPSTIMVTKIDGEKEQRERVTELPDLTSVPDSVKLLIDYVYPQSPPRSTGAGK